MDDLDGALRALAHAVTLAAARGYVRVFVDEGRPMAELLGKLIASPSSTSADSDGPPIDYLGLLARSFDDSDAGAPATSGALVVPLTDRELVVLRLLGAGMQYKAIAEELFVTLHTVKKHVTHILDKLGATNRTAAVARARALDLLH